MIKYFIVLFLITSGLIAQPILQWEKYYGGVNDDIGYSIKQANDGGFIIYLE